MKSKTTVRTACLTLLASTACVAHAADWSDTALSYRYGTKFAEPSMRHSIPPHMPTPGRYTSSGMSGSMSGSCYLPKDNPLRRRTRVLHARRQR